MNILFIFCSIMELYDCMWSKILCFLWTVLQVLRNIVYAKNLYDEMKQTVPSEVNTYD